MRDAGHRLGRGARATIVILFVGFNALPWIIDSSSAGSAVRMPGDTQTYLPIVFKDVPVSSARLGTQNAGSGQNPCEYLYYDTNGNVRDASTFILGKDSNFFIDLPTGVNGSGVINCQDKAIAYYEYAFGSPSFGGGVVHPYGQWFGEPYFQWAINDFPRNGTLSVGNLDPQNPAFYFTQVRSSTGQVKDQFNAEVEPNATDVTRVRRGVPKNGGILEGFISGGDAIPTAHFDLGDDHVVQPAERPTDPSDNDGAIYIPIAIPRGQGIVTSTFSITNAGNGSADLTLTVYGGDGEVASEEMVEGLESWNTIQPSMAITSTGYLRTESSNPIVTKGLGLFGNDNGAAGGRSAFNGRFNAALPGFRASEAARKRLIGVGADASNGASVTAGVINLGNKTAKVKVIVKDGSGKKVFARTVRAPALGVARLPFPRKANGSDLWVDFRVRGGGQSVVGYVERVTGAGDLVVTPAFPIR